MADLQRDDGVTLYYEVHGQGPAVLLTHGYGATSEMWRDQVAALKDRYKVIVWDMRGHGRTQTPDDLALYGEDLTVSDMAAILDTCGEMGPAVIGGLSLGGYSSLAFHATHPQRTRALMLFDTGPGFRKDEARAAWNDTAIKRAERLEREGFAALSDSAEVKVSTHRRAEGLALAARGALTQKDARVLESLPTVQVPTLVLVGAEDKNFLAATDYMAAKIPNADKVVIEQAGHAANLHQPQAFNRAMEAFLGRLPRQ